jgi:subtilisin-like proprotein convertase family protein
LNQAIRGANRAVRSQAEGGPFGIDEAKANAEAYLAEMYPTNAPPALAINDAAHVPPSWNDAVKTTLYQKVVAPYCQTCHRYNRFSYNNYATFQTVAAIQDGQPLIKKYTTEDPTDPNRQRLAFMPQSKLQWQHLGNDAEAQLAIDAWLTATTPPRMQVASTDTPLNIPDNDANGVNSTINISDARVITEMKVKVDITHTYIGDLVVTLLGPNNFSKVLQNRTGGNTHDLHQTYLVPEVVGRSTAGAWKLFVQDRAAVDVGQLVDWSIDFGVGDAPQNQAPIANAGADRSVASGASVSLSGAASSDPDGDALTFGWSQDSGPPIAFAPSASARDVSFVAPSVAGDTPLVLRLRVTDTHGAAAESVVTITVTASGSPPGDGRVQASSSDTPIAIPDNNPTGITSQINLTQEAAITSLKVTVSITHTYIGDLVVELRGPGGFVQRLSDRAGGNTHDLNQTFDVPSAIGQRTNGAWTLFVGDFAAVDVGTLNSWSLDATTGQAPPPPTVNTVNSSDTPIAIPDNDPTGITSTINGSGGVLRSLAVTVDLTHTYIGDLVITLTGPDGFSKILHNRAGGSAHDIHQTYQVPEAVGHSAAGPWQLKVQDLAAVDTGTLNSWSLQLGQ